MKSARLLVFATAVAALFGLSPLAKADGAVVVGLNTGGPLSLISNANVGWARGGFYWRDINPGPGQFNYGAVDALVNDANTYNLNVLFILSAAPTWCGSNAHGAKPCDIESWKTYVDNLTSHIHNLPYHTGDKIAAFEIWNEPDLSGSSTDGVGWDNDWNTYPRYVDYLVEAAKIIKRNHPIAKVVGPVLSGKRSDVYRMQHVFQDLENNYYYDDAGVLHNAAYFVDAISGHMDCDDSTHSEDAAYLYQVNVLNWLRDYNPSSIGKEQWITEFSWRSADIGEDSQRVREKNFLIEMTGGGYGYLAGWNFTHGFIYVCQNGGTSRSVYYDNGAPKLVVTQYLQQLGTFPATQQPGVPRE
jgi:hypothetical protein